MSFQLFCATLKLKTALGTPLVGDTLFGHCCWALSDLFGPSKLEQYLKGYTAGQPWLVVSDGFPSGYVPKPSVPNHLVAIKDTSADRKQLKHKRWIPVGCLSGDLPSLLNSAVVDETAFFAQVEANKAQGRDKPCRVLVSQLQMHNQLNRVTGSTGPGDFAPFASTQTVYAYDQLIDVYVIMDTNRVNENEIRSVFSAIGDMGFGRDASTGLGKFELFKLAPAKPPRHEQPTSYLTLGCCAPQNHGFQTDKSSWKPVVRFGRHGNIYASSRQAFKAPVMLAQTGSIFTPSAMSASELLIGQGLGGDGGLSKIQPLTVHQGYAAVLPIHI